MKLVIAEKPSIAMSLAAVLGATQKQDGYTEGGGYLVSWCVGHLVELAQPEAYGEQYARWRREDLPIIPEVWKYEVTKEKRKQLSLLKKLMVDKRVESIVCATDAGREGELIFRLVYNYCGCKKPIERLWISSMEDAAIREGFAHLRPGSEYDLLYRAAVCRAGADWLVGINGTRLFTVLYHTKLNVGRVMTPTLALVVQREAEINTFQSKPFYVPELYSGGLTASGMKKENKAEADRVVSDCSGKAAAVTSVDRQEKTVQPPHLYDLTTLQRECNRYFGYTAQQTLDYLQSLYEKKLATYPRTDSQYLTEDMKAPAERLVTWLNGNMPFAMGIGAPDLNRVIDNKKVSDHHAILPTMEISKTDLSALPAGERDVLILVAMRLLCAVDKPYIFEAVTAVLDCGGHSFTAKGKTVKQDGWKAVLSAFKANMKQKPQENDEEEVALPTLAVGQILSDVQVNVCEGKTSPPKHFTEDSLLAAMETAGAEDMPEDAERKGLGTPATRAATLEKLVNSSFVQRKKKQLLPTEKGINLIAVLPEKIKSPQLTAEWESMLKQVEHGEVTEQTFMAGIRELITGLVQEHTAPEPAFTALFAPENTSPSIGSCPRCGGAVRERQKGFFCENQDCAFALWKENWFFSTKKKSLTKTMAEALLKEGHVAVSGLYSEKTGKIYDATVVLDDTGGKYVNFKLEFPARKSGKK